VPVFSVVFPDAGLSGQAETLTARHSGVWLSLFGVFAGLSKPFDAARFALWCAAERNQHNKLIAAKSVEKNCDTSRTPFA
jgi:hypothetical protein